MTRTAIVCGVLGLAFAAQLSAQGPRLVFAVLKSANEVPAVSSPAAGRFGALIDDGAQTIDYELRIEGLQATITQAHIHFAQENVNGGLVLWLCGTAANPGPAGTQVCPQSGTITGTLRAADIQTVTAQGLATGEFAELSQAIRAGLAYVNVHTSQSAGGEIRGQIGTGLAGNRP